MHQNTFYCGKWLIFPGRYFVFLIYSWTLWQINYHWSKKVTHCKHHAHSLKMHRFKWFIFYFDQVNVHLFMLIIQKMLLDCFFMYYHFDQYVLQQSEVHLSQTSEKSVKLQKNQSHFKCKAIFK